MGGNPFASIERRRTRIQDKIRKAKNPAQASAAAKQARAFNGSSDSTGMHRAATAADHGEHAGALANGASAGALESNGASRETKTQALFSRMAVAREKALGYGMKRGTGDPKDIAAFEKARAEYTAHVNTDWDESKHPRDSNGEFTSK